MKNDKNHLLKQILSLLAHSKATISLLTTIETF